MFLSSTSRAFALSFVFLTVPALASAQVQTVRSSGSGNVLNSDEPKNGPSGITAETSEVQKQLREQHQEMERMRALLVEQSRVIEDLRQRVETTEKAVAIGVVKTNGIVTTDAVPDSARAAQTSQTSEQDVRIAKVEEQTKKNTETIAKQLGSMTFSGDLRMRYESFYGLLNASANDVNPAILGNPLSTRQRLRVRARFSIRGQIGKEFDWGLRLATGSFADAISTNQTLTDFYNRKPLGLDQAFISWAPSSVPGLRLQAGKFDVPWVRTELTIDNDLTPEGFNETYSRSFKGTAFKNLTFVAWQLPFLERNSQFVRNANGTVNLDESKRGGRDLALFGGQVRGRFEFTPTVSLTLSATDLYYSGTQFISPVQVFGSTIQLPVTFTIPATATSPAQTISTQISIPRDLLVAGNGNLGLSTATNNAVNRDGRLASGYNLVDMMGRLELSSSKRFPITLILDFVTNTQTHDVVVSGPGGSNLILKNNENNGYYAEIQAGRQKERGDLQFGYTFYRIEKDAVLTPFNFSDLFQQSDVRAHRMSFNYTADPRVILSFVGIISERPNGLLGVFGSTPPASLNRPTTRLQFDTTFRF